VSEAEAPSIIDGSGPNLRYSSSRKKRGGGRGGKGEEKEKREKLGTRSRLEQNAVETIKKGGERRD